MASRAPMPPGLSPAQIAASQGPFPPVPPVCVVTGGTGFVGQRLVEMLVQRGARRVVSFDVVPKSANAWDHPAIEYVVGDISNKKQVSEAVRGADCVWHVAAAVGPFHPRVLYMEVNYQGTLNVIEACREHKVPRIVMSSSPSTRFTGADVDGLTEAEMPKLPLNRYMQEYAETKAMAEMAMTAANCDELMTIAVAPHQVYGPRDNLFMPNILEAGGTGMLRIFGPGTNRVCFTHVDNYAHSLIIAERVLTKGNPAAGKFYIITDGDTHPSKDGYALLWDALDQAVTGMGFTPISAKYHLPTWLLYPAAHACDWISWCTGRRLKLNPFNVRVMTMHRWFRINSAVQELKYTPIIPFYEGWPDAIMWFKENWLPSFRRTRGLVGIAEQSQRKIDVQEQGVAASKKN